MPCAVGHRSAGQRSTAGSSGRNGTGAAPGASHCCTCMPRAAPSHDADALVVPLPLLAARRLHHAYPAGAGVPRRVQRCHTRLRLLLRHRCQQAAGCIGASREVTALSAVFTDSRGPCAMRRPEATAAHPAPTATLCSPAPCVSRHAMQPSRPHAAHANWHVVQPNSPRSAPVCGSTSSGQVGDRVAKSASRTQAATFAFSACSELRWCEAHSAAPASSGTAADVTDTAACRRGCALKNFGRHHEQPSPWNGKFLNLVLCTLSAQQMHRQQFLPPNARPYGLPLLTFPVSLCPCQPSV